MVDEVVNLLQKSLVLVVWRQRIISILVWSLSLWLVSLSSLFLAVNLLIFLLVFTALAVIFGWLLLWLLHSRGLVGLIAHSLLLDNFFLYSRLWHLLILFQRSFIRWRFTLL